MAINKLIFCELPNVTVSELLGPVEEVYAQEYSQSDIGVEADQYRCRPMSSMYAILM